ncbi:MAG: 5-methyltetrahydropteroyltriglutamate--homocysteine S-methyltransferase [Candidatus Microthrix sp.]|nr:5-methyltetrahydropteroyltriglutamate--homocysteine S-methyltransferase [Candidatus Microthrix sp.]MBK6438444.1 5-methyltetrahydropteroyltriglutamate--homocysteine S-methyltransferase [Candidatus Microthrix sp.]
MARLASNLGFPRMGAQRELKRALERHWRGDATQEELLAGAAELRRRHWALQRDAGIELVPSNDFSLYDHVLDTSVWLGALPERYRTAERGIDLAGYFAAARGGRLDDTPIAALEMTKWFDTNYHYIVPELAVDQHFELTSLIGAGAPKPLAEFAEAAAAGVRTRPVLLGPVSFLLLSKLYGADDGRADGLTLLGRVLPVYRELMVALADAGAESVQLDEPMLATDLDDEARDAYAGAYDSLRSAAPSLHLVLTSYFGPLRDNLTLAASLPVDRLHLDLVEGPDQLDEVLGVIPDSMALSLGLVDGRNVWRSDLVEKLTLARRVVDVLGADRVLIAPSCSLLHLPVDLETEGPAGDHLGIDDEVRQWLAFAVQRLDELAVISTALELGDDAIAEQLNASSSAAAARRASVRVHDPAVARRLEAGGPELEQRLSPYAARREAHRARHALPVLPTTTIGSFPQTPEIRKARAANRRGELGDAEYHELLKGWVTDVVRRQEEIGLDVLVHGEFERNDMVEYFGEHLDGVVVSTNGWVQSYGSRCVKPPIIFGDIARPAPMTVEWATYAQSLTDRPVKGMLTGPVTILKWSFVRDDQPRSVTCRQIALAIRDEVGDLEKAGIGVIQIDEPALREGLPLSEADRKEYLDWAVAAFRLASSGVADDVSIHTHMCYGEFSDVIEAIAAFDADTISIETARSNMELLDEFASYEYPNEIGPGVWDIHSPRIPDTEEMVLLLESALRVLPADRVWVNPDCGLKTRGWVETEASLRHLVEAARQVRASL